MHWHGACRIMMMMMMMMSVSLCLGVDTPTRHWLCEGEQPVSEAPRSTPVTEPLSLGATQETQRAGTSELQEGWTAKVVSTAHVLLSLWNESTRSCVTDEVLTLFSSNVQVSCFRLAKNVNSCYLEVITRQFSYRPLYQARVSISAPRRSRGLISTEGLI